MDSASQSPAGDLVAQLRAEIESWKVKCEGHRRDAERFEARAKEAERQRDMWRGRTLLSLGALGALAWVKIKR